MPATLLDKLLFPVVLSTILGKTIYAAVTGLFRGRDAAPVYTDHIMHTLVRNFLSIPKIEQLQWLVPSFIDTYKGWCSKNNVTPDIVDIPQTKVKGFWVGNKDTAKYTVVYIHGGGWVLPGNPQHMDLFSNILKWSNGNLAIFAVAYSLIPEAPYPVAIGECVEGLRYVLNLPGHSPENTLLGADSAGGDMLLAVLSHISGHPHPQSSIVKPLDFDGELKAAFAISPWVSSDAQKYPSWNTYANRDIFSPQSRDYWIETYRNGAPDDEYISPTLAEPNWWKTTKVRYLLITGGAVETLIDAISDVAAKYKQGAGADRVKYVIGENEVHISPLTPLTESRLDELGPDRCQEAAVRSFIKGL